MEKFEKKAFMIIREFVLKARHLAGEKEFSNLYELLDDIEYLPGIITSDFTDNQEFKFEKYTIEMCEKYKFNDVLRRWNNL